MADVRRKTSRLQWQKERERRRACGGLESSSSLLAAAAATSAVNSVRVFVFVATSVLNMCFVLSSYDGVTSVFKVISLKVLL